MSGLTGNKVGGSPLFLNSKNRVSPFPTLAFPFNMGGRGVLGCMPGEREGGEKRIVGNKSQPLKSAEFLPLFFPPS